MININKSILCILIHILFVNNVFSQDQSTEIYIPNIMELEIYNIVLMDALNNPRYEDIKGIFLIDIQLSNRIIQNYPYFVGIEETLLKSYNNNRNIFNFNVGILFNIRFYWYQEYISNNGNIRPQELIKKGIFPHILKLSKIGFNEQQNQAFLYLEHGRIPRASCGEYIYLKKSNNEWVIEKKILAWIS